jgi:hypothetical protein
MFALLKRAHALADQSLDDIKASLLEYSTENDLKVLRLGYVICRRRRELEKCDLIAAKIRKLEKDEPWTQKIN